MTVSASAELLASSLGTMRGSGPRHATITGQFMRSLRFMPFLRLIAALVLVSAAGGTVCAQQIGGELKQWHDVVLTFDGPASSESAQPNPFLDYRLNVTFTRGSKSYQAPGYFAADGNAAETSAKAGNK